MEVPLTAAWKDAPVLDCYPVHCHYRDDNLWAHSRAHPNNLILENLGLEPECFRLQWVSASEESRFAHVPWEMAEQVRKLGPSPYRTP